MQKFQKNIRCGLPFVTDIKARFSEMGMVKGTVVTVLKKAPLGDPIEIRVRGYSLCIRAAEAEYFIVRATDEQD